MKKVLSFLMVGVMLISLVLPVSAADDKNLEAAIKTVKSRIAIPSTHSEFNFNKNTSRGQTGYSLSWSRKDGEYGEIAVTITGNIITQYDVYGGGEKVSEREPHLAKLSSGEMYKKASEWVKKLNPTVTGQIEVDKDSLSSYVSGTAARFRLNRVKDGIKVEGDSGNISINKDTGELQHFNISWLGNVSFASSEKILSQKEIQAAYSRYISVEPIYVTKTDWEKKTREGILLYRPTKQVMLDANTGKISDFYTNYGGWYGDEIAEEDLADADMDDAGAGDLTPEELAKVETEQGLLTAKEVAAKIAANTYINTTGKYAISYSHLSYDYFNENKYAWYVNIKFTRDDKSSFYVSATVNAQNGNILNINGSGSGWSETFNEKTADSYAERFVSAHVGPTRLSEYKLTSSNVNIEEDIEDVPEGAAPTTTPKKRYYGKSYTYHRYVNGIKVQDDTISVSIDTKNKITNFDYNYSNIKFQSTEKMLSKSAALKELYKQQELELGYYINSVVKDKKYVNTSVPLYHMPNFNLNAVTGKLCYWDGREMVKNDGSYSDMKGHSLEKIVQTLSDNGIALSSIDGKLKPDSKISPTDFDTLVGYATNGYGDVYDVDEATGVKKTSITRKDAIKQFIDALGGKKFATLSGLYKSPYKDVKDSDELVGYYAFANSMGLIKATSGKIKPDTALTRGAALQMVYNYLNK